MGLARRSVPLWFAALAAAACSADPAPSASCEEGRSLACACSDGRMGAQVCRNGAYGACACTGGTDGGARADATSRTDAGADLDAGADAASPSPDTGTTGDAGDATPADTGVLDSGRADAGAACTEDARRCGATGVERCTGGRWLEETTCAATCRNGACTAEPAMCAPSEARCYRTAIERCNATGSAWLVESLCTDACVSGACTGRCVPGTSRCAGTVRETCAADGMSWRAAETCTLGCRRSTCVEASLALMGTNTDLSGARVYQDCVRVTLGGELRVPAGQRLEISARCLEVSASSRIMLGAGATLVFEVAEGIDVQGNVTGGAEIVLDAQGTLTLAGAVESTKTQLRADTLTIAASGRTAGSSLNAALYGRLFSNVGMHTGVVSVMPPRLADSPNYPSGRWWNASSEEVTVSWPRPFPGAMGYYVVVGDSVPGPANGTFRTTESIALPATLFSHGQNRVRIVSVNGASEVGTFFGEVVVSLNNRPPRVSSSSHPARTAWGGPDDIFLSWTDPEDVPPETFRGYLHAWDHQANTLPTRTTGTPLPGQMLLLSNQPPGIWYFHVVSLDGFGRTSTVAGHYQARIGPDPGTGNIAGTITDATTRAPIAGATIRLNGGLLRVRSGATGDYTFRGLVPAVSEPYRVEVVARGHGGASRTVSVTRGAQLVEDFALSRLAGPPPPAIRFGSEELISTREPQNPSLAGVSQSNYIWAYAGSSSAEEQLEIRALEGGAVTTEQTLEEYYPWGPRTEVGFNGSRYFAVDHYKCLDDGSLNYGHGWSCLRMKTWDEAGGSPSAWLRFAIDGHSGSPSAAFNGSTYGVFFISYSRLHHREIARDMTFTDMRGPREADLLASGHGDTRQSARTRAIWDGSGYAVAWDIERTPSDPTPHLFFGRWSRTLGVLQAPIDLGAAPSNREIGLLFDGTRYHLLFDDAQNVVLLSVAADGTVGAPTVVTTGATAAAHGPSLAWDGFNLLVASEGPAGSRLEIRRTSDHSVVESYPIPGRRPRVTANPETGVGVVSYVRDGTRVMPFELR